MDYLPTHPNPTGGAFAFFIMIPLLIVGISGEVLAAAIGRERTTILRGIQEQIITRKYAVCVGLVVGLIAVAAILTIWYIADAFTNSTTWVFVTLIVIAGVLVVSPVVGLAWLIEKCKSKNADS